MAVDTLHGAIRKEASMARRKVAIVSIPRMLVGANDIVFEIKESEIKSGDLKVSQGGLFWLPSGYNIARVLKWSHFARLAEEYGERRRILFSSYMGKLVSRMINEFASSNMQQARGDNYHYRG